MTPSTAERATRLAGCSESLFLDGALHGTIASASLRARWRPYDMISEHDLSGASAMGLRFDVFLSHASEDKTEVRALAGQLRAVGLSVWLDEEQMSPGFEPQQAIVAALKESRHVLIWVTTAWLSKTWTKWELELFAGMKNDERRVLPVLRVPWNNAVLGPYLTRQIAVPPQLDEHERLWQIVCGIRREGPGPREQWAERGRQLAQGSGMLVRSEHQWGPMGSIAHRLKAAYQRRKMIVLKSGVTTEINEEILDLQRELRSGPALHAGEFLGDGRFELIEELGQGGFATVWKAYDEKERALVAIKVLHGRFAKDRSRRERLFRGAKKMAELQHPNVVRVLLPEGEEQGFYYYVMEYVAGGDLHQAVTSRRLEVEQSLSIIDSIAGALELAHRRGLVHRDVKPQNILLHEDGRPVLSDFDLVQAKDTTGGTRTGAMGTVLYAAPEQNEDASRVDLRVDVYSLGMTAVFCVYRKKLPLNAMFDRSAFLGQLECSSELREVLLRAVALAPAERYGAIAILRAELVKARPRALPTLDPAPAVEGGNEHPRKAEGIPIVSDDGIPVDARFVVEECNGTSSFLIMSRGGGRNDQYARGLELMLARLARVNALIETIAIETGTTKHLALGERILQIDDASYPIELSKVGDVADLRRRIGRAGASFGRKRGSGGNMTKRLRFLLRRVAIEQLWSLLERGPST